MKTVNKDLGDLRIDEGSEMSFGRETEGRPSVSERECNFLKRQNAVRVLSFWGSFHHKNMSLYLDQNLAKL